MLVWCFGLSEYVFRILFKSKSNFQIGVMNLSFGGFNFHPVLDTWSVSMFLNQ